MAAFGIVGDNAERPNLIKNTRSAPTVAVDEAMLRKMFEKLDANGNGKISQSEFIFALRRDDTGVNQLFGLDSTVRQEDGTRDAFERVYQLIDRDDSKSIEWEEFREAGLQQLSEMSSAAPLRGS